LRLKPILNHARAFLPYEHFPYCILFENMKKSLYIRIV